MLNYRHGDVGLVKADIPADAKPQADLILARGEATGHAHVVAAEDVESAEILIAADGRAFIRVAGEGVRLRHEEHAEILVAPGEYEIRIAQEYDEEQDFRRVVD